MAVSAGTGATQGPLPEPPPPPPPPPEPAPATVTPAGDPPAPGATPQPPGTGGGLESGATFTDRTLAQTTQAERLARGAAPAVTLAAAHTDPVAAVVDELGAIPDDGERAAALGDALEGRDADVQAQIVGEVLARDPEAFDYDNWLDVPRLEGRREEGTLSDDQADAIAEGIAAAWNRGLIPEGEMADVGGSALDYSSVIDGFGRGHRSRDFVNFFDGVRSPEIDAFRVSYAEHLHENYVASEAFGGDDVDALRQDMSNGAALVAARLVSDNGVSHAVTLEFHDRVFGAEGSKEFTDFLSKATDAYYNRYGSFVRGYDPVIGFAEAARVPSDPHDLRYYDPTTTPAREALAIGLAEAVGRSQTDSGFFGVDHDGVLIGHETDRNARLEAITRVFADHPDAILDHLTTNRGLTVDGQGLVSQTHPALVNFFRHTVGNADLENREIARDAAVGYFDRQVERASDAAADGGFNRVAVDRASNTAAAAALATQDFVADAEAVRKARSDAASFVIDTALALVPFDRGKEAIADSVGSLFGNAVSSAVAETLTEELYKAGQGRITRETREALIAGLLEQGGTSGSVATAQEFLNLTVNPLQTALNIEDGGVADRGVFAEDVERVYADIIAGTERRLGLEGSSP